MLFTVTISSTLMPSGARPSKISCVSGKVTPSTSILAVRQIESTSSRFASSTAVRYPPSYRSSPVPSKLLIRFR